MIQDDPDLTASEKYFLARDLLIADGEEMPSPDEFREISTYFFSGWSHDKPGEKEDDTRCMDWDVDQWRIYSAFLTQYDIDLSTADLHWWVFMGLLTSLDECSYTRVIDIRKRKITKDMSNEAKRELRKAKRMYKLDAVETVEDQAFSGFLDDVLGKPTGAGEKERIEKFEKYADTDYNEPSVIG